MKSFNRLVSALRRLPGVGPKQAERLAIHIIRSPVCEGEALSEAILDAKSRVHSCSVCMNYTEAAQCSLCEDPARDRGIICVVEQPADVTALERSRAFKGLYHVLHGQIAPLSGIGPQALRIEELLARVKAGGVREVILATDPDTEGEATALYLHQLLKPLSVKVTRIAQGVPLGGDLDYLDEQTLSCALNSRREI